MQPVALELSDATKDTLAGGCGIVRAWIAHPLRPAGEPPAGSPPFRRLPPQEPWPAWPAWWRGSRWT